MAFESTFYHINHTVIDHMIHTVIDHKDHTVIVIQISFQDNTESWQKYAGL